MTETNRKSRTDRSALLVGCGDLGVRTGLRLLSRDYSVHGVRRNTGKLPTSFSPHALDYAEPGSLAFAESLAPDIVIATFNPLDRSEEGYRRGFLAAMENLLAGLGKHRPACLLMASSTRVYAEREGGWVDEASPLTEDDAWAASIIAAENRALNSGHNVSIVRFGGIYGSPGGRLLSRIRRGEISPREPVRYTNRIHREDCAGFLVHLCTEAESGRALLPVYTGVDDCPAPRYEVEAWLAQRLGVDVSDEEVHEPIRHNSGGHKRCSNRALRGSGYKLIYPDYRSGYSALLAQN